MTPYRKPQPAGRRDVDDRLDVTLEDGERGRHVRAAYVKALITVIVSLFLVNIGARLAAIPAALVGLVWIVQGLRARRGARVTFAIHAGRILIHRPGAELDVTFDELEDVRLDTKSTSKNVAMARADGVNSVFGAGSSHNIDVDVSRIELVFDDETVLLNDDFINTTLCAEELRQIRLFLRAHGWKPLDERA